mgnify:CR=1 FL=1
MYCQPFKIFSTLDSRLSTLDSRLSTLDSKKGLMLSHQPLTLLESNPWELETIHARVEVRIHVELHLCIADVDDRYGLVGRCAFRSSVQSSRSYEIERRLL